MTTGEIIKTLRQKKGLSQEELGKLIGVKKAAINKYETGLVVNLRRDVIQKLASALNTTPTVIMGWEDECGNMLNLPSNLKKVPPMNKVPLVGQIACGTPILAEENITDYIDLPAHIRADYALTCKGNSMIDAGIQDGDVVYIRQQPEVENGQIAAVIVNDDNEATLKRFYRIGDTVTLTPANPEVAPLVFVADDINNIRIVGLAVAYTHVLK